MTGTDKHRSLIGDHHLEQAVGCFREGVELYGARRGNSSIEQTESPAGWSRCYQDGADAEADKEDQQAGADREEQKAGVDRGISSFKQTVKTSKLDQTGRSADWSRWGGWGRLEQAGEISKLEQTKGPAGWSG